MASIGQKRALILVVVVLLLVAVAVAIALAVLFTKDDGDLTLVKANCGMVRGREVQVKDQLKEGKLVPALEFINIPYAIPPVGKLRWKPTVPLEEGSSLCWKGEYPANVATTKMCPQMHYPNSSSPTEEYAGDEDCLFLIVRTPKYRKEGDRPVIVWFHGGSMRVGYNDEKGYSLSAEFAVAMDAVVVNVNYRLHLLGYLNIEELWTKDPEIYGNYGFLDMISALKWVQKHIHNFGGDPNRVTIMAHSSGSGAAYGFLSNSEANGLFHRVIISSGLSSLKFNHTQAESLMRSIFLGQLGCQKNSSEEIRNCLLNVPAETLAKSKAPPEYKVLQPPLPMETPYMVSYYSDPIIIPLAAKDLSQRPFKVKANIPILTTNTAQEMEWGIPIPFTKDDWNMMYGMIKQIFDAHNTTLFPRIAQIYSKANYLDAKMAYFSINSDIRWICPENEVAASLAQNGDYTIYRLYDKHRPSSPFTHVEWGPLPIQYTMHDWDMWSLFDFKAIEGFKPTTHDLHHKDAIRAIYKKFIHAGEKLDWKPYPDGSMVINNEEPWISYQDVDEYGEICRFWRENGFTKYSVHLKR